MLKTAVLPNILSETMINFQMNWYIQKKTKKNWYIQNINNWAQKHFEQ